MPVSATSRTVVPFIVKVETQTEPPAAVYFDGVVYKVNHDLLQADSIAFDFQRLSGIELQLELLFFGQKRICSTVAYHTM
jgi:hypothetical protein